ncbi:MAG: queuosine precursor transporter [Paludibacteraceae bacterium]|nr:queuosine precursor transporter [Candidatus Colicola coprequi]MCQ2333554.1 queuosine precursor transporter [Paludibacteraceae bacterium]
MKKNTIPTSKLLTIIAALMVTCYLTANVMAVKVIHVFGISIFDAGTIIFPLTYMLGELTTELFGARKARQIVWLTFVCQLIFTLFAWIGTLLPYPMEMETSATAYSTVFTFVPRIMLASLSAFLVGEMTNVHAMAYIKQHWGGPLWIRTITSSLLGYTLDTCIFVLIAFGTSLPMEQLSSMILIQIGVKILIEATCSTPLTYLLSRMIIKNKT